MVSSVFRLSPSQWSTQNVTDRGMTLVEILVALMLTSILLSGLFRWVNHTHIMAKDLFFRVELNQEARLVFEMMAWGGGGEVNGTTGIQMDDPQERIPGFLGASKNPQPDSLGRLIYPYRLTVLNKTSQASIHSTAIAPVVVACSAAETGKPVVDCQTEDGKKNLDGFMGPITSGGVGNIAGRTPGILWTLIHPKAIPSNNQDWRLPQNLYESKFWTALHLYVDD